MLTREGWESTTEQQPRAFLCWGNLVHQAHRRLSTEVFRGSLSMNLLRKMGKTRKLINIPAQWVWEKTADLEAHHLSCTFKTRNVKSENLITSIYHPRTIALIKHFREFWCHHLYYDTLWSMLRATMRTSQPESNGSNSRQSLSHAQHSSQVKAPSPCQMHVTLLRRENVPK